MNMWIKNTKGKPDAMLTFALMAVIVVSLNLLFSSIEIVLPSGFSLKIEAMDGMQIAAYLGATLGAYVSKRNFGRKDTEDGKGEQTAA